MMRVIRAAVIASLPMVLISGLSFVAKSDPGDPPLPLIINNTLYSALDGYRLRGDHKEVAWDRRTLTPSTWDEKRDILFNFRRVDCNKPDNSGEAYKQNTDPTLWQAIDSCVNMAAHHGQYMQMFT